MENKNQWMENIPIKLWKLIFNLVKNAYLEKYTKLRNKAVAKLRKVCIHWRNVVDEHIEFDLHLTHKFLNKNYSMKHVKVNKCGVAGLFDIPIQPGNIPEFRNQNLVNEISFSHFVLKQNFLVMAEHFGEIKSVKTSTGYWCNETIERKEEKSILEKFLGGIEKLEYSVPSNDIMTKGWAREKDLVEGWLPNLKELKISFHWRLSVTQLVFPFLLRHPTVKIVEVQLKPFDNDITQSNYSIDTVSDEELYCDLEKISCEDLENIQLERISIGGTNVSQVIRKDWMQIIMAQKGLVQLKITNICESSEVKAVGYNPLSFDDLIPLFDVNMNTLASLELFMFHFGETVDFQIFQKLAKLQTLKIQKQYDGNLSRIVNMTKLPSSLHTLSISGMACMNIQLKHLVQCKRLKNLSNLQLSSIYYYNKNRQRPIVEEFMLKINLRRVCSIRIH